MIKNSSNWSFEIKREYFRRVLYIEIGWVRFLQQSYSRYSSFQI